MIALQLLLVIAVFFALLLAGRFALEAVNRRPHLGVLALFAWLAACALFIERPDLFERNVAGITIVVPDVLCAFLGAVAGLRILQCPPRLPRALTAPLLLVGGLLLLSYVRGVLAFGVQPSTNEFREFFYFLAALAFSLSFSADQLAGRIPQLTLVGGALLALVALVRIPLMGGFGLEQRAVPSYTALAIGQAFFFAWTWAAEERKSPAWRWVALGLLGLSVLMLHRSVWLALAAGLVVFLAIERRSRRSLVGALVFGAVVGAVFVGLFFGEKVVTGLSQAVAEATSGEGSTFAWRVEGWMALLRPESGWRLADLLLGNPMGAGYARALGDSVLTTHDIGAGIIPHNYYLSMILRGGLIGLLALIALYISLVRVLVRRRAGPENDGYAACFTAVLITQMVYYVPYSADMIQGVFLGAGIAWASRPALVSADSFSHEYRRADHLPQPV